MKGLFGVDVGTGNLLSAKQIGENKIEVARMRNMYLPVPPDTIELSELSQTKWNYIESRDYEGNVDNIYLIGEDALKFANMAGKQVQRPMNRGVVSTQEADAVDILTMMMKKLVGENKGSPDSTIVYSVPEQAIDAELPPVLYHEKIFKRIFKTLGYKAKPLNEAMAVIYSELQDNNFTGIGISFGAGLTNVACSYKGVSTIQFAVSRGGDYIDKSVADSLGLLPNKVTKVKEDKLNLNNYMNGKDKRETRILESLYVYYSELIDYVLKIFAHHFNQKSDEGVDISDEIPIILSGGTSLPTGFLDLFKEVFEDQDDFPYEISSIKYAENQLEAVAKGCLIYNMWNHKDQDEVTPKKEKKVVNESEESDNDE